MKAYAVSRDCGEWVSPVSTLSTLFEVYE